MFSSCFGLPGGASKPGRADLIETIRSSVIGDDVTVSGPFGPRRVTYADYTASGRSLKFIEDYIRSCVLPFYANTHTESSGTGLQTTRFREEARAIIRDAVGAGPEHAVVFCGSGSTSAINRIISVLGLRLPAELADRYDLLKAIPRSERPVVFIGPYEHHSNEVPWRETIADVVVIEFGKDGHIDLGALEAALIKHKDRPLRVGSFSAASNVTGILSDTAAVSALLHAHGALSFWDFAAAAPYVGIDVGRCPAPATGAPAEAGCNGAAPAAAAASGLWGGPGAYFDAVFISPHKFIGGPGTPGLLIARRALFANRVPSVPGGGTVSYVNPSEHAYVADVEHREEGGTPAIIESIRAGLVFQLKQAVGVGEIRVREESFVRRAIAAWAAVPSLTILGSQTAERLSIVSFVVRHGRTHFLHHNFVVALLNDLFGVQARGGCSCAGPYGHRLLQISMAVSHRFEQEIVQHHHEGVKPGWVRVNFNYFISEATFAFVVDAVRFVATEGHLFLPLYSFDADSGHWRFTGGADRPGFVAPPLPGAPQKPVMSLRDISYAGGRMAYPEVSAKAPESQLSAYLAEARRWSAALLAAPDAAKQQLLRRSSSKKKAQPQPQRVQPDPFAAPAASGSLPHVYSAGFEALRWFPLPQDAEVRTNTSASAAAEAARPASTGSLSPVWTAAPPPALVPPILVLETEAQAQADRPSCACAAPLQA